MKSLCHRRLLRQISVVVLCTASVSRAQVVITEIMHSPGGNDALWEWVEILNTTSQPVNLDGWVFDDDDNPNLTVANISAAGGTRNTIVPAGGVAVLYPGDELQFVPERFNDAWGGGIALIGVDGFTALTPDDSIGLWANHAAYMADAIPMATTSPRRTFGNAAASINYATGFPTVEDGHSIAWNGSGSVTNGTNWVQSQSGALGAFASSATTIESAQINSTNDRGNPGLLPPGPAAAGLLITEIMFDPDSPLVTGFGEEDFEWVEVYNNSGAAINFTQTPHVFDDDDGNNIASANLTSGALAAGEIGILFNSAQITLADMQAMWGAGFNYLPISSWPTLNNSSGGDTIAIWDSYSDYNSEPVVDSGRTHQNAVAAVSYDTLAGQGWPTANDQSSIWLNNLSGDPNDGANWRRAGSAGDTLSHQASAIFDSAIDHEGGDVGSPGLAPGAVSIDADGDYNDNGTVDAADYVVWRKLFGTTSSLPNDPFVGTTIDQDQYDTWARNFGTPTAGSGAAGGDAVPEPASGTLLAMGLLVWRRQRGCSPRARYSRRFPHYWRGIVFLLGRPR